MDRGTINIYFLIHTSCLPEETTSNMDENCWKKFKNNFKYFRVSATRTNYQLK